MAETSPGEAGASMLPVARLLDGRLLIRQPVAGHRAGTDAVLLAASVPHDPGGKIGDIGAGVGTVGLALALRNPDALVHLVDNSEQGAELAQSNAALNRVADRVRVHCLDLFDAEIRDALGPMTLLVSNPPFYLAGRTRVSPDPGRAHAHVFEASLGARTVGHGVWLRAMLPLLAPRGSLVMIHRPEALPALLAAAEGRLGAITVRPVHSFAGQPANRILFGGVAGSRAPFRLEPPLVLHLADGTFSATAEELHRGNRTIPLFDAKKSRPRGPAPSSLT